MASRATEIRAVATRLDGLLDDLAATIAALNAIISRPEPPAGGGADDERLVSP